MPRKANGEGTIYKRKDGRFAGSAFVNTASGASKRVYVYGASRKTVHDKLLVHLDNSRKGLPAPETTWTVASYLDYWLANVVPVKNRPRTEELYESTIRLHIKPLVGSRRLTALTVKDVQEAINDLLERGHSIRTVHKMRTVLSSALGRAQREELVHRNVARFVELPAWERKEIQPWQSRDASQFLQSAQGHIWEVGYMLLILYGMRRGEVLGLRWSDIDLANDCFYVRQQIQRIDGALTAGPVKTSAGRRTLPLLPMMRQALEREAERRGVSMTDSRFAVEDSQRLVIHSKTGQPVDPKNFVRAFKLLSAKAGLPIITVHHVRHTAATLLKNLGVPARDAQLILGHASVTTTQELYQHGDIKAQREAMGSIERMFLESSKNSLGSSESKLVMVDGSDGCCQSLMSTSENRRSVAKISTIYSGGPAGTRTPDTLLKSTNFHSVELLSTSVIKALRAHTITLILGHVAVNRWCQTVVSSAASRYSGLSQLRVGLSVAMTNRLRELSFPYSLLMPTSPLTRTDIHP
ncbi:tyrosine-type recombinase/integrase [Subtercola frigoramans]|uniref:Integrase n=1 Tax=Subtercola frigoramans TaxID=120298 RepID=A0ABS2L5Y3_9MICO|nr:site-specific integrase [Subtercola frigoramans]MBM7472508.1 integrase [Subtercola frigoramans]